MGTTPHTIRLTDDQVDKLTEHGTKTITDAIRDMIETPTKTTPITDPSILRATMNRANKITITIHLR